MRPTLPNTLEANELNTLRRIILLANKLAKKLNGPKRSAAYRIKAEACSSLLVQGRAHANGVRADGIIALNISHTHRIHIRRAHLTVEAQRVLEAQLGSVPTVGPMAERRGAEPLAAMRRPPMKSLSTRLGLVETKQ